MLGGGSRALTGLLGLGLGLGLAGGTAGLLSHLLLYLLWAVVL